MDADEAARHAWHQRAEKAILNIADPAAALHVRAAVEAVGSRHYAWLVDIETQEAWRPPCPVCGRAVGGVDIQAEEIETTRGGVFSAVQDPIRTWTTGQITRSLMPCRCTVDTLTWMYAPEASWPPLPPQQPRRIEHTIAGPCRQCGASVLSITATVEDNDVRFTLEPCRHHPDAIAETEQEPPAEQGEASHG